MTTAKDTTTEVAYSPIPFGEGNWAHPHWCMERGCSALRRGDGKGYTGDHGTIPYTLDTVAGYSLAVGVTIEAGDWCSEAPNDRAAWVQFRVLPNDELIGDPGKEVHMYPEEARLLARLLVLAAERYERTIGKGD